MDLISSRLLAGVRTNLLNGWGSRSRAPTGESACSEDVPARWDCIRIFRFSGSLRTRSGTTLPLTALVIFLLAFAWADVRGQSNPSQPVNRKASAASERPKYLVFWHLPEKAAELAEQVGMKGDGKTRLLGFGLPTPTFELEEKLPDRIRSAFAAARSTTWR